MKRIRKAKTGLDSVAMKRSIQEQLAKEMGGMNTFERLAYKTTGPEMRHSDVDDMRHMGHN